MRRYFPYSLAFCLITMMVMSLATTSCNKTSESEKADYCLEFTYDGSEDLKDEMLFVDVATIAACTGVDDPKYVSFHNDQVIPSQLVNIGDDELYALLLDIPANSRQKIKVKVHDNKADVPTFKQRTQAEISHKEGGRWEGREYKEGTFKNVNELRVPDEHTDHSYFIRYEGPGWESDKVGYRFYLDWRNAVDIFGKKTTEMVLQDVGQDGFDSYHEMSDWGMDVLKVGSSLGLGSVGYWNGEKAERVVKTDSINCKISENGPILSAIQTDYYGWKSEDGAVNTNLKSILSINAGSRLTYNHLESNASTPNLCTGIVKHEGVNLVTKKSEEGWSYFGTYGEQSLAGDNLGMAIIYKSNSLKEITQDSFSYVIVLEPDDNMVDYFFLAAWEGETDGIKTQADFKTYLDETIGRMNAPIEVTSPFSK